MATGAISHANEPSLFAFCARSSEAIANRSCASREKRVSLRAVLGERAHQPALVVGVLQAVENMWSITWPWPMRRPARAFGSR